MPSGQEPSTAEMPPNHFNKFPAELRIIIFNLVLGPSTSRSIVVYAVFFGIKTTALPRMPALLQTCRQLREEGLAFYCRSNSFKLGLTFESDQECVRKWLSQIGEYGKHIRHLQIWTEYLEFDIGRGKAGGDWKLCELRLRGVKLTNPAIRCEQLHELLDWMRVDRRKTWDRVIEVCGGEITVSRE